MGVVYQHRRNDTNEIFYVGIGVNEKRPYDKNNRNKHWINIVNKHGYTVEILHENLSHQECKIIEIDLIEKYGRKDLGTGSLCNLTDGGEGALGYIHSDVSKRKISEFLTGKKPSDETKRKLSESKTGEKHPMFGKKHTEETKIKISESQLNMSDETKRKMSESKTGEKNAMFGKKHTEETKIKMIEIKTGEKNHFYGKTHSDETKRKMRETRRKNKESLDN
jgi:group I intron endonuclease